MACMMSAKRLLPFITLIASAALATCGPTSDMPVEEPVPGPGYPPPGANVTPPPGMPPGAEPVAIAPAPPAAPTLPPKPEGSECAPWTPSDPLKEADGFLTEVNGKGIVALQQVSCRSGAINPPPCDIETCEAWVRYLSYDALVVYQKFEMDLALEEAVRAVKKGRECGLGGKTMARAYIGLGYILAGANGELMKASNAFRWGLLHEWTVQLPFDAPPPTIEMTFKAAQSSLGTVAISCVP